MIQTLQYYELKSTIYLLVICDLQDLQHNAEQEGIEQYRIITLSPQIDDASSHDDEDTILFNDKVDKAQLGNFSSHGLVEIGFIPQSKNFSFW